MSEALLKMRAHSGASSCSNAKPWPLPQVAKADSRISMKDY
jgi:hypothetical protein